MKIINFVRKIKKFKIVIKKIDKKLVSIFSFTLKVISIIEFIDKLKTKSSKSGDL